MPNQPEPTSFSPPPRSSSHNHRRPPSGALPLSFVLEDFVDSDFIDLTAEASPPTSSRTPAMSPFGLADRDPDIRPPKRRRPNSTLPAFDTFMYAPNENIYMERNTTEDSNTFTEKIDLTAVDDDAGLQKRQEEQRQRNQQAQEKKEETQRVALVKRQHELSKVPPKLAAIQCVVCMESMTDITATACGHLYCHICITEALIAGENQGPDPGKGPSRCPVCRKKVVRSKEGKESNQVIPLEFMLKRKSEVARGKEKVKDVR